MNMYVSNLSSAVNDEGLKALFLSYGDVSSAKVILDRTTGQSRGFGFVEMSDNASAGKAIAELNGVMLDGKSIKVSEARPKENKNNSDFSSRRW